MYSTISTPWPSGSVTVKFSFPIRPFPTVAGPRRRGSGVAHAVRVVGVSGNVVELALAFVGLVEQLEILVIVDLHEHHLNRSVRLGQREGLLKPEHPFVEVAGLLEVADIQRHVRHAQDFWPGGRRLRGQGQGQKGDE
jgi:hypothetical protein